MVSFNDLFMSVLQSSIPINMFDVLCKIRWQIKFRHLFLMMENLLRYMHSRGCPSPVSVEVSTVSSHGFSQASPPQYKDTHDSG